MKSEILLFGIDGTDLKGVDSSDYYRMSGINGNIASNVIIKIYKSIIAT